MSVSLRPHWWNKIYLFNFKIKDLYFVQFSFPIVMCLAFFLHFFVLFLSLHCKSWEQHFCSSMYHIFWSHTEWNFFFISWKSEKFWKLSAIKLESIIKKFG